MKIIYLFSSTHRHGEAPNGERIAGESTLMWPGRFWFEQILETQWPLEIYLEYVLWSNMNRILNNNRNMSEDFFSKC